MKPYPPPTRPGHYWAKLIHPSRMPEGEDWHSVDWEVVQVGINDPGGKLGEPEYLSVLVPGIEPCQWVEDIVWGPPVAPVDEADQGIADTRRLDFLDQCNARLNAKSGTTYAWTLILNHNVNRLMVAPDPAVDLRDYDPHGYKSCRAAIDERIREIEAARRASPSPEPEEA